MVDDKDIRLRSHVGEAGADVTIALSGLEAEKMGNDLVEAARILKARTEPQFVAKVPAGTYRKGDVYEVKDETLVKKGV
jgi:hypothetical protein